MTSIKMAHRLSPALFLLYIGPASASGGADDLNTAFIATLGQPAPVVCHLAGPAAHTFWGNTLDGEIDITLSLEPQFLVPLGGARYALLIHETTRLLGGGAPLNAVTVAYLDRIDGGWAVEHVWFEAGGLGLAGNEGLLARGVNSNISRRAFEQQLKMLGFRDTGIISDDESV
jgi:hypothetical protein